MNASLLSVETKASDVHLESLEVPLIEGGYAANDYQDPVLSILTDLISYHKTRNFSHYERYGRPDPWSEEMLAQLGDALEAAKEMLVSGEQNEIDLRIESSIKVTLEKH